MLRAHAPLNVSMSLIGIHCHCNACMYVPSRRYKADLLLLQIWVKPSAEMQYMYGNHVMKSGLGRITENTPAYTGVVIYSMSDIPLGFGVTAKSTTDCRKMDPSGIVVFHQADVGKSLILLSFKSQLSLLLGMSQSSMLCVC